MGHNQPQYIGDGSGAISVTCFSNQENSLTKDYNEVLAELPNKNAYRLSLNLKSWKVLLTSFRMSHYLCALRLGFQDSSVLTSSTYLLCASSLRIYNYFLCFLSLPSLVSYVVVAICLLLNMIGMKTKRKLVPKSTHVAGDPTIIRSAVVDRVPNVQSNPSTKRQYLCGLNSVSFAVVGVGPSGVQSVAPVDVNALSYAGTSRSLPMLQTTANVNVLTTGTSQPGLILEGCRAVPIAMNHKLHLRLCKHNVWLPTLIAVRGLGETVLGRIGQLLLTTQTKVWVDQ
nr:hypothetical protein [Tanacetum cinerariifolium]